MLSVLNGGYNTQHSRTFVMSRPKGLNNYILLIIKTPADFDINGTSFTVQPGSAVLIDRNTPYQYHNPDGEYSDDWLHIECTQDQQFRSSGVVFNEVFLLRNPSKFTSYIQHILWEKNYTSEPFRSDNVDMLLRILINNIILAYQEKDIVRSYNPYHTKLQNVRMSLQTAPYEKHSPADYSKHLGISTSYFQHLYTVFFGISFQSDLINIRLEYAKNLILSTSLTIEQIAEMSGYSNEIHFYRQFRKKTGMTPIEYRKSTY